MIRTPVRHRHKLRQLHQACQASGLPWVSYRLPGETEPVTIIQLDPTPGNFEPNVANGFVIAPFDFPEKQAYWLRNDLTVHGFSPDLQFAHTGQLQTAQLIQLAQLHEKFNRAIAAIDCFSPAETSNVEQPEYEAQVKTALSAIKNGWFEKVVLSRTANINLPEEIQPEQLFEALCALYPTAFVSIYQLPDLGCWIGASPELLLASRGDNYESMSLAGTLSPNKTEQHWRSKEQNEQQIVTRYIKGQLQACGLNVSVGEQETIQAGQVYHLRNSITATGQSSVFEVVQRLHPTPAVCGFPLAAARDFIRQTEKHPREFYCGFLGPIAADGNAILYVNLRAARLDKNRAQLYLGGGIVAGSDPAAEWEETQAKAATLIAAINHARVSA